MMNFRTVFICCITLFIMNCSPSIKHIEIQGHRGCRGLLPENSLPAFKKALDLGVHTLELDLAISKDHKVVVSHEPFMNHEIALQLDGSAITEANERSFNLYQMDYDSIRKYDCGSKTHPRFPDQKNQKVYKPLLNQVIRLAGSRSKGNISFNIEIKSKPDYDGIYSPDVATFVRLTIEVLEDFNVKHKTVLQSFDTRALEEIHKQAPDIQTSLLVDEGEDIAEKLKSLTFTPEIISPYFKLLTKENVRQYQEDGFRMIPWTLNSVAEIELMIDFGVDGIISDYPDRLVNRLQKE